MRLAAGCSPSASHSASDRPRAWALATPPDSCQARGFSLASWALRTPASSARRALDATSTSSRIQASTTSPVHTRPMDRTVGGGSRPSSIHFSTSSGVLSMRAASSTIP